MTVKEFLEETKRRGAFEIGDPDFGLLQVLRREGFTEEEANNMKMEKAWKFYFDSLSVLFSRMGDLLSKGLDRWPERASIVAPYLKKITKQIKEQINELEEELHRVPKKEDLTEKDD